MNRINLHIHTIASDGIKNAKQIIDMASNLKLHVISITDHDSIDSVLETMKMATVKNIVVISGVELTAEYSRGQCHILGYNIDLHKISAFTSKIKNRRIEKAKKMIFIANSIGYDVEYSEVLDVCENGVVGRRDIAKVMVEKGYFSTEDFAIQELFMKNKPCYVKTEENMIEDCVQIIKDGGGVAILAHPWTLNLSFSKLCAFISKYKFDGIEVYNHGISKKMFEKFNVLADELDLLKTCGTDYHGHKGLEEMVVHQDVDCTKFLKKLKVW